MTNYLPCYRCSVTDPPPLWRGLKYGWLCLTCFAEKTDPKVIVATDEAIKPRNDARAGLQYIERAGRKTWRLVIFNADHVDAEEVDLGAALNIEGAVDEAKWLLNKRAWKR